MGTSDSPFAHLLSNLDDEDELRAVENRTLDEAIAHTRRAVDDIVAHYNANYEIVAKVAMFSGGNDSTTFLHLFRDYVDRCCHVNTGIGVPETREHVRRVCAEWSIPLDERTPPPGSTYRELVLQYGFPGPGSHGFMYRNLKERAFRLERRSLVTQPRKQRVVFLAGMRHFESERRMMNTELTHVDGSIVWISPLAYWTDAHMAEYRRRFDVPRNEVSDCLHMSGECLCGSYAKPGELEHIRFFYPHVAAMIDELQEEVAAAGRHATWGTRPPGRRKKGSTGPMCAKCELT